MTLVKCLLTSPIKVAFIYLFIYRGMAKWFGAHYNQEVRFSSVVKCKKGPHVPSLIKDEIIIIITKNRDM